MSYIINNLAITHPKLVAEWHPTKNGDLKPEDVTAGSNRKVWWYLPFDDLKTGKHFDFEWQSKISYRTSGCNCPYISGKAIWVGFNDLATTHPKIAEQWHPTKNGKLKPTDITAGSSKRVWWLMPYDDPKTGKHFDFEWKTAISNRKNGRSCPFLSGKLVWRGFNDLASTHPNLASEWHPTKNGKLKPTDVTAGSGKKVWWFISYDDIKTGKHFDFEWQADINSRLSGRGCPYLKSSKLERFLHEYLNRLQIQFKIEKKFCECKDITQLPFDVYLNKTKQVIEIDGMQHFRVINFFGGNKAFILRQQHDEIKDDFCRHNNIPLLRIPYIYDSVNDKEEIITIIDDFINYNVVPEKIREFYKEEGRVSYIRLLDERNKM